MTLCHGRFCIVNHRSNATSLSLALWREFCNVTGKTLRKRFAHRGTITNYDSTSQALLEEPSAGRFLVVKINDVAANFYRQYYFRNPCVPVDFATISDALKYCPRTPSSSVFDLGDEIRCYSSVGTVVLMPGVYRERIQIEGEIWAVGQTLKSVAIRAAFPAIGAALMHYHCPLTEENQQFGVRSTNNPKNQSCITISTRCMNALDGVQKGISVTLSHLKVLHSTPGVSIVHCVCAVVISAHTSAYLFV